MTKQTQNPKFQDLKKLLPNIKKNVSLKEDTTFKIGGRAKYFYDAKNKEDLIRAILAAKKFKLPFFILGRGSNILVADKGFDGLAIKIKNEKLKMKNYNSKFKIFCQSGVPLAKLVSKSLQIGATGLEWAIGIPGTIGGAIRGNAGAFNKSMTNIVKSVEVLEITGGQMQNAKCKMQNDNAKFKIKEYKNKDCKFSYRESIFKKNKNLIILSAELQLKKGNKNKIKEKMKEYLNYRKETQPLNFPSAGSVFKNPKVFSAGELIEKCGLKGKRLGGAKISEKHGNFIINLGNAKAGDVAGLINLIKQKVKKKFGIILEEEIEYLGLTQ
ncbi:MAG: UDP-N-acetylenolpyruvoylglucosamine reductase [Candidatus Nealsonbacteria bacterium CG08_land_8_20_14_0_20_38_20]|uniref:UDP-N-acetylenolpyruvoylglucosamine reductase n=1 Tax=Candidatus Nealsonbacteria bacterium CG08_land_8_20_14_0_20_38_20 TaxID=1974705 RepID=A0A2H0YLK5_9BACT|nr:MAG: UDP-N-acetylenolpyruvoylglucosamine reductase [Candidatus Nealsonbacteria bacterium CG08_land_8_20_14_0_20_38_20]